METKNMVEILVKEQIIKLEQRLLYSKKKGYERFR